VSAIGQDIQARRMQALDTGIARLQTQIASGKRVSLPSDAPVDAARISELARTLADERQQLRNIGSATARLTLAADAAAQAQNLINRARELALAAGSDSANADDRAVAATEIALIGAQLLDLANSRAPDGRWLFAGSADDAAAYALDAGGVFVWQGSGTAGVVPLGDRSVVAGEPGPALFGDSLNELTALAGALGLSDAPTRRAGIDTGLAALDAATARLAAGEGRLGATLARLEQDKERLTERAVDLTAARGALEDTDIAKAATDLQRLLTLLEATRQTYTRVQGTTLFDLLR
jgi:flagellar hook-associated protein 3 FlgL